MPKPARRSIKIVLSYALGSKPVVDTMLCDEFTHLDNWLVLFKSDSEIARYNLNHVVRLVIELGTPEPATA